VASVREVKSRARVWRSKEWLWRVLFARKKEERERARERVERRGSGRKSEREREREREIVSE